MRSWGEWYVRIVGTRRVVAIGLVLVSSTSACSGETEKERVKLDFTRHTTVADEEGCVVPGVEVCADGHPEIPCATTDDFGIADLALPSNTDIGVSYTKEGFIPKLHLSRTGGAGETTPGLGGWLLQRREWYLAQAGVLGGTFDLDTKGLLSMQSEQGDGVDFDYSPHAPEVRGAFWFRQEGGGTCGVKLGVCVIKAECDTNVWAWGDVPEGAYDGTAALTANLAPCAPEAFACDGKDNCTSMEARAGWVTHAGWTCD